MLADVLAVAASVGETWVVSPEPVEGATWIPDPGGGQGAAVEAALQEIGAGPVLVVNSDLPSVDALTTCARCGDAIPERGHRDRPGRRRHDERARALGTQRSSRRSTGRTAPRASARMPSTLLDVVRPGLRDDVDTPADLVNA